MHKYPYYGLDRPLNQLHHGAYNYSLLNRDTYTAKFQANNLICRSKYI